MPANKGNIFKGEGSVVYLLNFIPDAYHPKVGLKLPKEVIDLPCVSYPIVGWSFECILLWGSEYSA